MNIVNVNLSLTMQIIDFSIKQWLNELNTDGKAFDFDSQDAYKEYVATLLVFNFKDKIEGNKKEDQRLEILSYLKSSLKELIKIYEQNSTFFIELDREALRLKKFREHTSSVLTDIDLTIDLYKYTELPQRAEYFKSDFYKNVGFLNYNYHQEIYNISKRLLKDIESDFKDYEMYDNDYLFINDKPIFSMGLITKLHSVVNNQFIEDISEYDFYREINILHTVNKIKITEDFLYTFMYVIHCLHNSMGNKSLKKKWLNQILKEFKIKRTTYDSKYRHIISKDSNDTLKEYANLIESVFK
ncbi:hypothetical protein [Myroides odoratimimus]|uniref:hypothetical protein n=1 Tax=Myroides odoratimimus TaxID=76832 RepID=UPI002DBAD281|nr:hypothetical protein [Myroides odoratimimus]MEC4028659.1 hypothetical protein [Myroides odoratimimus]